VREAVFNTLFSLGGVEEATVFDLFAGSGALGIEALSRGASHATFVESDRAAIRAIEANLTACGFVGDALVVTRDVPRFLAESHEPVDIAFVDPPYAFDGWPELLANLTAARAVLESDREIDLPPGWRALRSKRYGSTVVTIAETASSAGPAQERP
jgi:16S rRNA (guanine966-N2)-methyltransferase